MLITLVEATPRRIRYRLTSMSSTLDTIVVTNRGTGTGDLRGDAVAGPLKTVLQNDGTYIVQARRRLQVDPVLIGVVGDKITRPISIGGGKVSYGSNVPFVIGAVEFNPSNYTIAGTTTSVDFRFVATRGTASLAQSYYVELYDTTNSQSISFTNLMNTTSLNSYEHLALTIGVAAGNIKTASTIYEVRLYLQDPSLGPGDTIEFYSAEIRVNNTIV